MTHSAMAFRNDAQQTKMPGPNNGKTGRAKSAGNRYNAGGSAMGGFYLPIFLQFLSRLMQEKG